MFKFKLFTCAISMVFLIQLIEGQDSSFNYYVTTQQAKNPLFTLITTSTTNNSNENDGTISLHIKTVVSYVYDQFTYSFITMAKYNSGALISIKTEAFTKTLSSINTTTTTSTTSMTTPSTSTITSTATRKTDTVATITTTAEKIAGKLIKKFKKKYQKSKIFVALS